MFITVLSRHFPSFAEGLRGPHSARIFEILHLVESSRYHSTNLSRFAVGHGEAPEGFSPGVDFPDNEVDIHYRGMAACIEFESFLSSSVRFLNLSWVLASELAEAPDSSVDTLRRAISLPSNHPLREAVSQLPFFIQLQAAWERWARELVEMRDYVEHYAPFGGGWPVFRISSTLAEHYQVAVPQEVGPRQQRIQKDSLRFQDGRDALTYTRETLGEIDQLAIALAGSV